MSGHVERPTGSPMAGEPAFLAVGMVRRPHGVSGDVLVEIYTDFPERLKAKAKVYVGEKHLPLTITRRRNHNEGFLLAFDGFTTPEEVGRFRNQMLYMEREDAAKLPEGEYYLHELIGLTVLDESGGTLGKVTEIIETGANDVYVVTNDGGGELLLPAISEVVLEVNLSLQTMKVHLLPGLMNDREENRNPPSRYPNG